MNEYTPVIGHEKDYWIGWIEEVPGVNYQEKTYGRLVFAEFIIGRT